MLALPLLPNSVTSLPTAVKFVPPFATGKVPETCVVSPTLPQLDTVVTPPEISTLPVATAASFDKVVDAEACNKSPIAYVVCPVPPCAAVTAALSVRIVADALGSVKVFSDVVGPVNFVNPFPVPPNVEAIIAVMSAEPLKALP